MKRSAGKGKALQLIALIIVCILAVAGWSKGVLGTPLTVTHTSAADFDQGSSDGGMAVGTNGGGELQSELEPVTWGSWSGAAPLPVALQQHAAVVVAGRVYVIGGYDGVHAVSDVYTGLVDA